MAFCPNCGSRVEEGSAFCVSCGKPVAPAQNTNQQSDVNRQQPYAQQPVNNQQVNYAPVGGPVDTNRSIVKYILLSIVTCGIYAYYFIYKLAKDVNQICEGDGENVGGLVAYTLLSIVTCGIYSFYWLYKIQNRLQMAGSRLGVPVQESGGTVLLWMVIGMVVCAFASWYGMHIVCNTANKVGAAYNTRYFGRP